MFTVSKTHKMGVVFIKSPKNWVKGSKKLNPIIFQLFNSLNDQVQQKKKNQF